ncbi:hypothetical protein B0H13DRAFT_2530311 [Mycena leptocephala]|nr:hypothetical protein B0H13DRAFT_2530311 [Mycena leptocephala]
MLITLLGQQTEYKAIADEFYRSQGLEHLLNVCNGNKLGAKKINTWFGTRGIDHLVQDTHREMDVLSTIFLQSTNEITPEGLLNFDFEREVTAVCEEHAPKLRRVLMAAAQTLRAARENTLKDPAPVVLFHFVTMIQAQLAKHRSQNNNLCAIPCSMYFLSSGMPRKVIDTLAHAGMSLSYDTTKTANRKLAVAQIGRACLAARTGHAIGWDNIHVSLSQHVEQWTMAPAKVQTGTAIIIYDLRGIFDSSTLALQPILDRRASANIISYSKDIRPTRVQARSIHQHLLISIVELFIAGDADFDYLEESPELQHPQYRPPPADHITQEHVLRTTTREEGSTAGTTQLSDETYLTQLEYDEHALDNIAVPSYNDQKTNALIRSAQLLRMGDMSVILRLQHYQLAPGLFHVELNLAWLILKIHRGNVPDLGSLQYFIGLLAKTRLGSAQPDFKTMVSLFMQVLTGAVQHFFKIETGMSRNQFVKTKPTASKLLEMAERVFRKYASDPGPASEEEDDFTFRNMRLLMRDLLVFYLLRTSISSGDFGRVELLLGKLTLMFSGGGCPHYQQSYFISFKISETNVMRDNAIISTSGRSYVGVDKNIEFNINFQKNYFTSKGVHGSWDLLSDLAPNVPIFRRLKTQFGDFLGAPWQGIHHTKVNTNDQVAKVQSKMSEFELHLER